MFTNVSPTCSPCGHVMQPVGPRTVWERQIGGAAASFWPGTEYECVSCRTRTVLVDSAPFVPGSVGYAALEAENEARQTIPAKRFVWAEHLPADVRRDSHRIGGTRHLSQRQQAASIVEDFFAKDETGPLDVLLKLAELFDLDVAALTQEKAEAILASVPDHTQRLREDGSTPCTVCGGFTTHFEGCGADVLSGPYAEWPDADLHGRIAYLEGIETSDEDALTGTGYKELAALQAERARRAKVAC